MAEKIIQLQSSDGVDDLFPLMQIKCLWSNEAPTSSFTNVNNEISLDLSKYDMYAVECRWSSSDDGRMWCVSVVGNGGFVNGIYSGKQYRSWTTTSTGITFNDAKFNSSPTGTMATDNTKCIPMKIYGLACKEVV